MYGIVLDLLLRLAFGATFAAIIIAAHVFLIARRTCRSMCMLAAKQTEEADA